MEAKKLFHTGWHGLSIWALDPSQPICRTGQVQPGLICNLKVGKAGNARTVEALGLNKEAVARVASLFDSAFTCLPQPLCDEHGGP